MSLWEENYKTQKLQKKIIQSHSVRNRGTVQPRI